MAFLLIIYTSLFFYPDFYRSFHRPLHPTDIDYLFSSTINPPQFKYHCEVGYNSAVKIFCSGRFHRCLQPKCRHPRGTVAPDDHLLQGI